MLLRQSNREPQKHKTLGISPPFVAVWKVRTDIAQRQCAQQCVGYRMSQRIRIRMPFGAEIRVDRHAAEDQSSVPRPVYECQFQNRCDAFG